MISCVELCGRLAFAQDLCCAAKKVWVLRNNRTFRAVEFDIAMAVGLHVPRRAKRNQGTRCEFQQCMRGGWRFDRDTLACAWA